MFARRCLARLAVKPLAVEEGAAALRAASVLPSVVVTSTTDSIMQQQTLARCQSGLAAAGGWPMPSSSEQQQYQQRRGLGHSGGPAAAAAAQPAAAPKEGSASLAAAAAAAAAALPEAGPAGLPGRENPFGLVREEINAVTERLRRSIFTDIPALERAAEYFFQAGAEGKRLRSSIILLMASALSPSPVGPMDLTVDESPHVDHPPELRRRQQRVAEIAELIHVASLLHDDVIDNANTRRGLRALNTVFGNKVAILAGDFLLARSSVALASLRNPEVIMLISQVLEHLVAGEILQLTTDPEEAMSMDHYMRKTYYKTASLMANSCKSVAVQGGYSPEVCMDAWAYGRHLGLAFQLVDDIMDFTVSAAEMGKPALNDLRSGLATAPVLFAAKEHPDLYTLIERRFKEEGDVEAAQAMVEDSSGIARARELAAEHAAEAAAAVRRLPLPSDGPHVAASRAALLEITNKVLNRRK